MRQADPLTKNFDLRSHVRDPKTGKTIREQHYIWHESKEFGKFFEVAGKYYNVRNEEIEDPRLPHGSGKAFKKVAKPVQAVKKVDEDLDLDVALDGPEPAEEEAEEAKPKKKFASKK